MLYELVGGILKIVNTKLSELEGNTIERKYERKQKCVECKYERKQKCVERKYERKQKCMERKCNSCRIACYRMLERKMARIRTLESEIAALTADKSVFIQEFAVLCRNILLY
jgi:hypothetical protein